LQIITIIDAYSILYFWEAFFFEEMVCFPYVLGTFFPPPRETPPQNKRTARPMVVFPGMAKVKEDVKVEVKVGPNLAQKLLGGSSP